MSTITVPKTEYQELKKIAERYRAILRVLRPDLPEESIREYKNETAIRRAYLKSRRFGVR